MHYPGERCPSLLLPGPKFIPELLPPCPAHPEPFANTCHPLSITKGPAPRWQSCPQGATAVSLLPCQPLVQKCLLLYPEPCETTRLLPRPRGSGVPQTLPAPQSPRGDKKRVARSLPPCAPRCPEPGRLRFPPCGIRCSSASCRGECRSHKVAACLPRCPELSGGYSLPLRGVTECPPQQSVTRSFLQEQLAGVAPHRCSKGYPTQEFVTCCSTEQRLSSATTTCGVTKATKECPPLRMVAKGSLPLEGTKGRSCSAQHLSKSRCGHHHPRGSPRPSRLAPAGAKRSSHSKKSRSASKWLW
ncbi:keratinocyte proline-rich protein-like [Pyrgilauda ruficollis]|uniref:keratinocyte proline-rich protein-like n=1 Tax=Pyrgilauda ruficollis TaxID=221976 RepID=UPI001B86AFE3|nr:keratinocyte proline-rich protein-like [Pyrgilauda ruficollis]